MRSHKTRGRDINRSCLGKRSFETRDAAVVAAEIIYDRSDERMFAYKCKFCPGWHIGHPAKR